MLAMQIALFDIVLDGMREARTIFLPEQINEFPPFSGRRSTSSA